MLWSLMMQSHKKYSQRVEEPFHVTMASLDITKTVDPVTQVMVVFGGNATRYLLCSLNKKNVWQVPLNLHMEKGTFITLSCNGGGYVHLTGYYKNPKLSDPSAVISKVISAHIHEGLNTIDDTKDYLKQNREKVEYQRIIHGSWLVQKINAEEENQENGRKAKSKRKANSQEDRAAKRTKPSANSNENRSNDDDCDQNIENLGKLIENNNYYFENGDNSDCDENEGDSDYDEDEDESDYDGYSSSFYSGTTYVSTSSGCDSDNDEIKMQSEEDTSQGEEKNEKQKQEKKVTGEEAVEKQKDKKKKKRKQRGINKWVLSSGVRVKRLKPGTGKVAEVGKFVTTYYLACFMHGVEVTKLNHCLDGRGFRFKLGAGYVPHGVDEGIVGMKVGEKRRLLIPPRMMGKGSGGAKPRVPPGSTLVYDVELIKVE
ncbi:46 kDa FK506-binding nuclear protein-like isoform X1 [Temnothorax longispinosus]